MARRRRLVQSRLVSLAITVAVLLLIYLWRGRDLEGGVFVVLYALILGISLALLGAAVVLYVLAKREFGALGSGTAIRIGLPGMGRRLERIVARRSPQSAPSRAAWGETHCCGSPPVTVGGQTCRWTRSPCFRPPWTALFAPSQLAVMGSTCRLWKAEVELLQLPPTYVPLTD